MNTVIQNGDWERLRRHPPCIMPDPDGEAHLIELALQRVRDWSATRPPAGPKPLAAAELASRRRQPRDQLSRMTAKPGALNAISTEKLAASRVFL